jgi:hypothetical protein
MLEILNVAESLLAATKFLFKAKSETARAKMSNPPNVL